MITAHYSNILVNLRSYVLLSLFGIIDEEITSNGHFLAQDVAGHSQQ